ncbi:putative hydrolase [Helianthus annuus]|uniref:Hydrolase n=1 Tax=Helianthus annuus TaxID=4232 RepID=A0A251SHA3_HELAN|nr:putative hydrolase [Helianthus annuus]KAJ0485254.1 putative hydrolase [Helianthus annuus]KAJ0655804.1 putative hydrolase [Helianthus annuus]KAJ0659486.1 putative hydrolase [Helianthus annuus]KAJ0839821.1 putative hydrolase [Helianthus annuus]
MFQVFVVQEKSGTGVWKLPTATVEEGEDISAAAIWEVKEEAGVYWMAVEEYAKQPFVKKHKSFDYIAKICIAKKDNKYVGFSPLLTTTASSAKKSYLYSN